MFSSVKNVVGILVVVGSVSAFAKGTPPPQTHQCMKDGSVVVMTKKECKKSGGAWEKMAKVEAVKAVEAKPAEVKPVEVKATEVKPAPAPAKP
jgi:hypothetical protein